MPDTTPRRVASLVFAAWVLTNSACDCAPSDFDRTTFRCATDQDCGAGWFCESTVCAPLRSDGGSVGDAGAVDSGASHDSGVSLEDAGALDASISPDGGVSKDAGVAPDGGVSPDAGVEADAGASTDSGFPSDAGSTLDAGLADAGIADAGTRDAGTPDAGIVDAGSPDAGPVSLRCFKEWCWVHPRPSGGAVDVKMTGPNSAVVEGQGWMMTTDGTQSDWVQNDAGNCWGLTTTSDLAYLGCIEGVVRFTPSLLRV